MQNLRILAGKDFWENFSPAERKPQHAQEQGPGLCQQGSFPSPSPWRNQEPAQLSPQKHFGVGGGIKEPSSPSVMGTAAPAMVQTERRRGTSALLPATPSLSAGQCQPVTGKLLPALGMQSLFWSCIKQIGCLVKQGTRFPLRYLWKSKFSMGILWGLWRMCRAVVQIMGSSRLLFKVVLLCIVC